jgi:hypothetical protein
LHLRQVRPRVSRKSTTPRSVSAAIDHTVQYWPLCTYHSSHKMLYIYIYIMVSCSLVEAAQEHVPAVQQRHLRAVAVENAGELHRDVAVYIYIYIYINTHGKINTHGNQVLCFIHITEARPSIVSIYQLQFACLSINVSIHQYT